MDHIQTNRREFLKKTGIVASVIGLAGSPSLGSVIQTRTQTKLPRWRGFNLIDFIFPKPFSLQTHYISTDDDLRFIRDLGFDFVRLPMNYAHYLDIDYNKDITQAEVYKIDNEKVGRIHRLVDTAHSFGLHVSLNLHRAPGYCINNTFNEPYNLWLDEEAQNAFNFHWGFWGKLYENVSSEKISFDLVNEPSIHQDNNDPNSKRVGVPGEIYREVVKNAAAAIRESNPRHLVIADGNNIGNNVIPEIVDLNIGQSCRGYFPHYVSHHKASWMSKEPDTVPDPTWPGIWSGKDPDKIYSRKDLKKYYQPWVDLAKQGIGVHCGECGCWNKTPHDVFLSWFEDVLDILTENNIGWALWNFKGPFGVLDSNRIDVDYEDWNGHKLDRRLLTLLQNH